MHTHVFKVPFGDFIVHRYDDLLSERIFCGHVEARFQFAIVPIDDFLDLIDFLVMKMCEHFLDLQGIYCNVE